MKSILIFIPAYLFLFFEDFGQIKLPGIFGDHMVIQRNQPVPVWGWSSPDEKVTVTFNRQTKGNYRRPKGKWHAHAGSRTGGRTL